MQPSHEALSPKHSHPFSILHRAPLPHRFRSAGADRDPRPAPSADRLLDARSRHPRRPAINALPERSSLTSVRADALSGSSSSSPASASAEPTRVGMGMAAEGDSLRVRRACACVASSTSGMTAGTEWPEDAAEVVEMGDVGEVAG